MTFDVARFIENIESSFKEGGARDFRKFIERHSHDKKWIIACDFNTDSKEAVHDVYSFAVYPVSRGLEHLRSTIVECLPRDFKKTRRIKSKQKMFLTRDLCFCFVFLVSKDSKFLRNGDTDTDLQSVRSLIGNSISAAEANGTNDHYVRQLRNLLAESEKKTFSISLFERILMLSMLNAYVSAKVVLNTKASLISWLPDKDNMTTYSGSIFNTLSHINFHAMWHRSFPNKDAPVPMTIDRHKPDQDFEGIVDEMIRVPDCLSAVAAQWNPKTNLVALPQNAKPRAMERYRAIIRYWLSNNPTLWLTPWQLDDDDLMGRRINSYRSLGKLKRVEEAERLSALARRRNARLRSSMPLQRSPSNPTEELLIASARTSTSVPSIYLNQQAGEPLSLGMRNLKPV